MKIITTLVFCVFLSGCGTMFAPDYEPVLLHEKNDVEVLRARLNTLPPRELMYEVVTITNYRCDMFFEALDRLKNKADFTLARLAFLSGSMPTMLAAAEATSQEIAHVAAALGFATGWMKDTKDLFLLAEFKPAIYKKWQDNRLEQLLRMEALFRSGITISDAHARQQLYEYTRMCLPWQLKAWLHESANSSVVQRSDIRPLAGEPRAATRNGRSVPLGARPIVME